MIVFKRQNFGYVGARKIEEGVKLISYASKNLMAQFRVRRRSIVTAGHLYPPNGSHVES